MSDSGGARGGASIDTSALQTQIEQDARTYTDGAVNGVVDALSGQFAPGTQAAVDPAASGDYTLDLAVARTFRLRLTGSLSSLTFTNVPSYATIRLFVEQDAVGGRTWVQPGNVRSASPVTLSSAGGTIDFIELTTFDAGTSWFVVNVAKAVYVRPATVPATPVAPIAAAGNGLVSLTVVPPDNGGAAISGYVWTLTDTVSSIASFTTTTSTPSATFSGLTNGNSYTASVHATNSVGSSSESASSNVAIPQPPSNNGTDSTTGAPTPLGSACLLGGNFHPEGTEQNWWDALVRAERDAGVQLRCARMYLPAVTSSWFGANSAEVKAATGLTSTGQGKPRLLFMSIKTCVNGDGVLWNGAAGSKSVTGGYYDAALDARAAELAAFLNSYGRPVVIIPWHEPENDQVRGLGPDFVAMYRYVRNRFIAQLTANGANAALCLWGWCVMAGKFPGSTTYGGGGDARTYAPPVGEVDWLGADGYDFYGTRPTAKLNKLDAIFNGVVTTTGVTFYQWATQNYPGKPLFIGEFGAQDPAGGNYTRSDGTTVTATPWSYRQWLNDCARSLAAMPYIAAAMIWSNPPGVGGSGGDYRYNQTADAAVGWTELAAKPYLQIGNPPPTGPRVAGQQTQAAISGTTSGNTLVGVPGGYMAGDVMLLWTVINSSNAAITWPAGFTQIGSSVLAGTTLTVAVASKKLTSTSGEGTSGYYYVNSPTAVLTGLTAVLVRGASASWSPTTATVTEVSVSSQLTAAGVTASAGDLVLALYGGRTNSGQLGTPYTLTATGAGAVTKLAEATMNRGTTLPNSSAGAALATVPANGTVTFAITPQNVGSYALTTIRVPA